MAMNGNLRDMALADLIQHNCQDRKTARLAVRQGLYEASLYFDSGKVVHAEMDGLEGEEVIFQILRWEDGEFSLDVGVQAPASSIARSWSGLLLEGARRMDEDTLSSVLSKKEETAVPVKKKSELLAEALDELLAASSDIEGAGVVGIDGLVYSANVPQRGMDETMVGAAAAAAFGLSRRSAEQLKRGAFAQTLIQGEDGNIIVATLNSETIFVGLTPKGVNLGMAFAEVRSMIARLKPIL